MRIGGGDGVDHSAEMGVNALKGCELAGPGCRSGGRSVRQREHRGCLRGAIQNGMAMRDGYTMLAVGGDPGERRGRGDVHRRHGDVV